MAAALLSCSCPGCFRGRYRVESHGCGNASRSITKYSSLRSFKIESCGMTQTRRSPKWKIEQHNKKGCGGYRNCRMMGFSAVMW